MRTEPTFSFSNLKSTDHINYDADITAVNSTQLGFSSALIFFTTAAVGAQFRPCNLFISNNTSGYLDLSAEL
jgi:hypothetical protein